MSPIYYLGRENHSRMVEEVVEFIVSGEMAEITSIPGKQTRILSIQDARTEWNALLSSGFRRVDVKVAKGVSGRHLSRQKEEQENRVKGRTRLFYDHN